MKAEWMFDARKIPDEVMDHLRRIAVRAVEEKNYSPELVADFLGISRSSIYDWLRRYHAQGESALDTKQAPGGLVVMTPEMDQWLKETILNSTPQDHGYDTVLWTLAILVELLKKQFNTWVSDSTVALHLHRMRLSCQKPCYRALGRNLTKIAAFVNNEFPEIQRLAQEQGADILFEDESGIGVMTRSGRTWGEVNSPPQVRVSDERGGYNVLSMVTAQGELVYEVEEQNIDSERYIAFLGRVLEKRSRPIFVIADNASFHKSNLVKEFVQKNSQKIQLFFLPPYAPELNPDEQVWNEIKHRELGKQPIKNKSDLHQRIYSALGVLQRNVDKVKSFFQLEDTRYAAIEAAPA